MPIPPLISSSSSAPRLSVQASKKSLTKEETEWTLPVISVRKILQDKPVECLMMGNLHRVKLLQFAELKINGTILIRVKQEMMGIIKHSTTLFHKKLIEAWRLRDTKDSSSLLHFDSSITSYKIMNILI